jgi:hypothetical protein
MNYLAIHTQSNLILQAVTSPHKPTDYITTRFIEIGDITLSKFYKLLSKTSRNGRLVDIGELAAISPYFLDSLHQKV